MRGWIPPLPLACGVLSFGLSWIVLFALARDGATGGSLLSLAWVHLVALAWITTIALSILLHAIPGFLDVDWEDAGAKIARACTPVFALCALALALGFFIGSIALLEISGTLVLASLMIYVVAIASPLLTAMRGARSVRPIARAFAGTLALLLLTAVLGTGFAYALGGHGPSSLLVGVPQSHALLGIGGWLTLLVFGVSARTLGPIAGARSRALALHIGSSSAVLVGTLVAACGAGARLPIVLAIGSALLVLGTLAYAADIFDVIRRATVPHRPPQILMLCAGTWAILAAAGLFATALGSDLATAAVYAALIGWIGSAVLAHLHHIGIRVLLTNVRGEDDETRPESVLDARLTWATLALYQVAALAGATALATRSSTLLEIAAIAGFCSFVLLIANASGAIGRARRLPIVLGTVG